MKERNCSTCRFWRSPVLGRLNGQCHRYPQPVVTHWNHFCGEWVESGAQSGMDTPIERLGLSPVVAGTLKDAGIRVVGDLLDGEAVKDLPPFTIRGVYLAMLERGMIHPEFEE